MHGSSQPLSLDWRAARNKGVLARLVEGEHALRSDSGGSGRIEQGIRSLGKQFIARSDS